MLGFDQSMFKAADSSGPHRPPSPTNHNGARYPQRPASDSSHLTAYPHAWGQTPQTQHASQPFTFDDIPFSPLYNPAPDDARFSLPAAGPYASSGVPGAVQEAPPNRRKQRPKRKESFGEDEEDADGDYDGMDDAESEGRLNLRKHVCPTCNKKFNRPSSLRIHLNTHTGAMPFVCPHPGCGRAFNVNSNMRRHYRNHPETSSNPQSLTNSPNFGGAPIPLPAPGQTRIMDFPPASRTKASPKAKASARKTKGGAKKGRGKKARGSSEEDADVDADGDEDRGDEPDQAQSQHTAETNDAGSALLQLMQPQQIRVDGPDASTDPPCSSRSPYMAGICPVGGSAALPGFNPAGPSPVSRPRSSSSMSFSSTSDHHPHQYHPYPRPGSAASLHAHIPSRTSSGASSSSLRTPDPDEMSMFTSASAGGWRSASDDWAMSRGGMAMSAPAATKGFHHPYAYGNGNAHALPGPGYAHDVNGTGSIQGSGSTSGSFPSQSPWGWDQPSSGSTGAFGMGSVGAGAGMGLGLVGLGFGSGMGLGVSNERGGGPPPIRLPPIGNGNNRSSPFQGSPFSNPNNPLPGRDDGEKDAGDMDTADAGWRPQPQRPSSALSMGIGAGGVHGRGMMLTHAQTSAVRGTGGA
ncbi:C2h2 conidiation transcription factor [Mycena kentingensis (nom. inval.)]|nr:C2h2 conidiation transcription factor [Mycena kentingensis (nom. inval.)]